MKHGWWLAAAAIVIVLLLGGTAIIFYCHRNELSYSFDFGSILDAVVFLLVGAFVEYAYSKRSSDKRADTDLLLEVVREGREALAGFERESQACGSVRALTTIQQRSLSRAGREFSNALHSIEQGLRHCEADLAKLDFQETKDTWNELKESITDSPYPGPYDQRRLGRIRKDFKSMRDQMTRIAFAINHR